MIEACVAVLFAYKWLHNFVKALDEISKKIQTDLMAFVGRLEPLNDPLHLLLLISRKKTIHLCQYGQWLHNNATDCEFSCKLCY